MPCQPTLYVPLTASSRSDHDTACDQSARAIGNIVKLCAALILDEPTMGLDVLSGEVIYRFIEAERDRGKAILFSTHQMVEVELLADRVGVLSCGRLVAEGTPASLIERTGERNLARAFLALVRGDRENVVEAHPPEEPA